MQFWRLVSPDHFSEPALHAHHNHGLCAAAVVLAMLAAWILLPVTDRYHSTRSRLRFIWLGTGAIAMGIGIWAMHFTAMIAYGLPVPISYSASVTTLSILPAVLATASCVLLLNPKGITRRALFLSGLLLAGGIGSMHYLGMEAVIVNADMYYDPIYFGLSLIAAFALGWAGLVTYQRFAHGTQFKLPGRLAGSIILGAAVSSMHFIAMRATYFQANAQTSTSVPESDHSGLITGIIVGTGILLALVLLFNWVSERLDALNSLLTKSEARFQNLAETTQTAIFTFDAERVTYANPALSEITGHSEARILEMSLEELLGPEFAKFSGEFLASEHGGTGKQRAVHRQIVVECANGEKRWLYFSITRSELDDGAMGLGSAVDITEQKSAELRMQHLAFSDSLTSLANRALFIDRLHHHLELRKRRSAGRSCVMLLDLDSFKSINDTYGHLNGDKLLVEVARRLTACMRASDTVARLGGDEFVILVEAMEEGIDETTLADRIVHALSKPVSLDDRSIEVNTSIGIVKLNAGHENPDQVLLDADVALYRAKERGRARWVIYDSELGASAKRSRELQLELKSAVADSRLELHYQPIVDTGGIQIAGFEALARWTRENGEVVAPSEFIPLAEESGLIVDIDMWAIERAARALRFFGTRAGWKDGYVSINVCSASVRDERLIAHVRKVVREQQLEAGRLRLEITERTLIDKSGATLLRLQELLEAGCELMIDDFGTGYSSLSYLHRFPISTLKIDRSFVDELGKQDGTVPVIRSIIALANSLEMNVIAEGVETDEQRQVLTELGIEYLQGYMFGKPRPEHSVLTALRKMHMLEFVENSSIMKIFRLRGTGGQAKSG